MGSISPNAKHVCVFSPVRTHARGAKAKNVFSLDGLDIFQGHMYQQCERAFSKIWVFVLGDNCSQSDQTVTYFS